IDETDDLRVLLSRDTSPNAYSLGEGTFVFNISLLSRLENEEQLYFIMAHELSHYVLNHLGTEVSNRMSFSKSKKYKKKKRKLGAGDSTKSAGESKSLKIFNTAIKTIDDKEN